MQNDTQHFYLRFTGQNKSYDHFLLQVGRESLSIMCHIKTLTGSTLLLFIFWMLLKYSWFTMLCYFLLYSKVMTQLYILSFFIFFFIRFNHRILNIVPCSSQSLLFSLLRCVWLFVTSWTETCQALLSFTISWSLLKFMSIESVMLTISSSVTHFSFCFQSFSALGSFPVSWLFTSDGQTVGALASATVLSMSTQGWFLLGLTGLISLQSEELSRVCSSTTIQKHQFFSAQSFLWSSFHICTWLLEKP